MLSFAANLLVIAVVVIVVLMGFVAFRDRRRKVFFAVSIVGLLGFTMFYGVFATHVSPQPTPTPVPNGNNLASFPTAWQSGWQWGYPTAYTFWDSQKQAICLIHNPQKTSEPDDRELDLPQTVPCKPGDHIVFKAELWTSASTIGEPPSNLYGANIGLDFYGPLGFINSVATTNGMPTYPHQQSYNWVRVQWRSNGWVTVTIDFTLQQYQTADWAKAAGSGYSTGQLVAPTGFIPWISDGTNGSPAKEEASIWVRNTVLYINP